MSPISSENWILRHSNKAFTLLYFTLLYFTLWIPNQFVYHQRSGADGMERLCMLLRRLPYPCRYWYMIAHFSRPVPVMSTVTNTVLDYIYTTHSHRILQWNQTILQPAKLMQSHYRKPHWTIALALSMELSGQSADPENTNAWCTTAINEFMCLSFRPYTLCKYGGPLRRRLERAVWKRG